MRAALFLTPLIALQAYASADSCKNYEKKNTRKYINCLFATIGDDNFGVSFEQALSDDLVWTVTGSSPIAGVYDSKQKYTTEVLEPLRDVLVTLPVPIVENIFIDGDWAVVNWRSEGVMGKNGADYDMKYSWSMRSEVQKKDNKRKIVEVIGFYDSVKVTAVFEGYEFDTARTGSD